MHLLLARTHPRPKTGSTEIAESDFTSPARRDVLRVALQQREQGDLRSLTEGLSQDAMSLLTELSVGYPTVPDEEVGDRVPEVFGRLKLFRLERDIKSLRTTLQEVNPQDDAQQHDELFTQLVGLEADAARPPQADAAG